LELQILVFGEIKSKKELGVNEREGESKNIIIT
jgi:hypothetical protein